MCMMMACPAIANAPTANQPMAQGEPQPMQEQPSTIGGIISGVFGGGSSEQYPPAPVQQQQASGGPLPPGDVGPDDGYDGAVPPGDIGQGQPVHQGQPRRTTLLDLIMGQ